MFIQYSCVIYSRNFSICRPRLQHRFILDNLSNDCVKKKKKEKRFKILMWQVFIMWNRIMEMEKEHKSGCESQKDRKNFCECNWPRRKKKEWLEISEENLVSH